VRAPESAGGQPGVMGTASAHPSTSRMPLSSPSTARADARALSSPPDEAPSRGVPSREWATLSAAVFALTTLFAFVFTLRVGMSALERGELYDWPYELTKVLVHWWASLPFVPLLAWLVRRAPLTRGRWGRNAVILLAGTLVASVGRSLLDPALARLLGETIPEWIRATRVLAAYGSFLAVVGMLHALFFYREMRDRERDAARLSESLAEAQLAASEARLAALRAQLQPHFLFNALNAVAALLHHDTDAADRMLTRLADLLRSMLRAPATEEHSLREELELLQQYLDVMAYRFGPRLRVDRSVDESLLEVAVPWLVMQPLLENALEHGLWARSGPGTLRLEVAREGQCVRLMVEDDGVGSGLEPERTNGVGIGLANTRRRLSHLYGDAAALSLQPRAGGGTRAVVLLPLRPLPTGALAHG